MAFKGFKLGTPDCMESSSCSLLVTGQKVTTHIHKDIKIPKIKPVQSKQRILRQTARTGSSRSSKRLECSIPNENLLFSFPLKDYLNQQQPLSYNCLKTQSALLQQKNVPQEIVNYKLNPPKNEQYLVENAGKLNLNNLGLTSCAVVENECQLKFLSCENNSLSEVSHLDKLVNLVQLILTNNRIRNINGIEKLESLKVLVLKRNRIVKLEGFDMLNKLETLDLEDNKISVIENLDNLVSLKELNLSSNLIDRVQNLQGLLSLVQLDLQKNKIESIVSLDGLPKLQKLFLNNNNITSLVDVGVLAQVPHLEELNLNENPVTLNQGLGDFIKQYLPNLKVCHISCSKPVKLMENNNEVLRTLSNRPSSCINNSVNGDLQLVMDEDEMSVCNSELIKLRVEKETLGAEVNNDGNIEQPKWSYEIIKSQLILSKPGSVVGFQKNWGLRINPNITSIKFVSVEFTEIVPYLEKLRTKYPNLSKFEFNQTNILSLEQLDYFTLIDLMESLDLSIEGNPVTKIFVWRPYLLFRLSHLPLKYINGIEVTAVEIQEAIKIFEPLLLAEQSVQKFPNRNTNILSHRTLMFSSQQHEDTDGKNAVATGAVSPLLNGCDDISVPLSTLKYTYINSNLWKLSETCINANILNATELFMKKRALQLAWPNLLNEMVSRSVDNIFDVSQAKAILASIQKDVLHKH